MKFVDQIRARGDAREVAIVAHLAKGEHPFRSSSTVGWTLLVSLDPSKPGQWRITRFDGNEPTGHTECATYEAAVRELYMLGGHVPGDEQ